MYIVGIGMWLAFLMPLIIILVKIGLIVYLYKDAKESGRDPWLWVLLALFTSSIVTLVIYLIVDDESSNVDKIKCSSCGYLQKASSTYCSSCGSEIKKDQDYIIENKKSRPIVKILVGLGALILLFVLSLFALIIFGTANTTETSPATEAEFIEESIEPHGEAIIEPHGEEIIETSEDFNNSLNQAQEDNQVNY